MDIAYRCPHCKSYDTSLWNSDSELVCLRCHARTRTSRVRLYILRHRGWIKNWLGAAFYVLLLTIAPLGMLLGSGEQRVLFTDLREYHKTTGTVIQSKIRFVSNKGLPRRPYTYDVWYRYSVGNTIYTSNVVNFSDRRGSYEYALAAVQKYPNGSEVSVYYLPADPAFSALSPEVRDRPFGLAWCILVLIVIAMVIVLSTIIIPMVRYHPQ